LTGVTAIDGTATTLSYSGGVLSQIAAKVGTWLAGLSAGGNLTTVTDPDGGEGTSATASLTSTGTLPPGRRRAE
jgi:hypothetical protein